MGNCSTIALPMEWASEEWGSVTSEHEVFEDEVDDGLKNVEKERLLDSLRASSDANGKVKMMISKKELAEFLLQNKHDIGAGNTSAQQALVRLINAKYLVNHHRPWAPVLQSIPEVN
ncbi:hypothetical protein Lal_00037468 [Lupinus albus]|uniref:Uncharacterized protein n=1 Tax=Lupinus albus TaxID=3870 RepID=A0A6A5P0X9_LUPAL|nr:hypothetical protein Lalb_Chr18g0056321 [Lupinus albus]KAF1890897.1 hypothetical protein Lal_00037468 [Lupinus albus]